MVHHTAAEEFVLVRQNDLKDVDRTNKAEIESAWATVDCDRPDVESLPESPRSMNTFVSEEDDMDFISISVQQKQASVMTGARKLSGVQQEGSPSMSLLDLLKEADTRPGKRDVLRTLVQFLDADSINFLSQSSLYIEKRLEEASYMESVWRKLFLLKFGKGKTDKRHRQWKSMKSEVRSFWRAQYMEEYALEKKEQLRLAQIAELKDMMTLREETNEAMKTVGNTVLAGLTKQQCREYYKSIRSKPQGKRGKGCSRTHEEPYYDDYSF